MFKIDHAKAIINIKAFIPDDKEIIKIIEICNLKLFYNDWQIWTDNNSGKLFIKKNMVYVRKVDFDKPIIDDIYAKAPPKTIINNSKFIMILWKGDDFSLWCLGVDNLLRVLSYNSGEWENKPPLLSGIDYLRIFVKHLDIDGYKIICNNLAAAHWPLSEKAKESILLNKIGDIINEQ